MSDDQTPAARAPQAPGATSGAGSEGEVGGETPRAAQGRTELRERVARNLERWWSATAVICEHSQMIPLGSALDAVMVEVQPELDRRDQHIEELQDKVSALSCCCSLDDPGDVCALHSPRLKRAEQRAERAEATVERMRQLIDSYPPGSDFVQSGAQELFRRALLDNPEEGE